MIDALVSKGDISSSTVCLALYLCFISFLSKLTTSGKFSLTIVSYDSEKFKANSSLVV